MTALHVLFVCTANICRSPYMELQSRTAVGPASPVTFSSAGTHGFEHRPMNRPMASVLPDDVDPAEFRSRRLTDQQLDEADLVLCAEASHRQFVLDEHPAMFRKVFTLGQFAEAVRRSAPDVTGPRLVAAASTHSGIAQFQDDVADPYGRGTAAAERAARQIDDLLAVVLPALIGAA